MKVSIILLALIFTVFYFLLREEEKFLESVLFMTHIKSFLDDVDKTKVGRITKFYNKILEDLLQVIKDLRGDFFKGDQIKNFLIIRSFLFIFSGKPMDKILLMEELEEFKNCILSLLFEYKGQGYVNSILLEKNKIYNLYRSFFLDEFIFTKPDSKSLKEIEYFQSLILLILILEYELHIKYYEIKLERYKKLKVDTSKYKEGLQDLKVVKRELIQNLVKSVRQSLTCGRIYFLDRIYTGFDTEYQSESDTQNSLLAYTTSSYSRVNLCIKPFGISEESTSKSTEMILELLKMIRFVTNKQDLEIEKILKCFSDDKRYKKQISKNLVMFTLDSSESEVIQSIKNSYYDLESGVESYSFKTLVEKSLSSQNENIYNLNKNLITVIKNYKIPRIPVKKELILIAHFTTADICS